MGQKFFLGPCSFLGIYLTFFPGRENWGASQTVKPFGELVITVFPPLVKNLVENQTFSPFRGNCGAGQLVVKRPFGNPLGRGKLLAEPFENGTSLGMGLTRGTKEPRGKQNHGALFHPGGEYPGENPLFSLLKFLRDSGMGGTF